jgi:hypothetical protein
VRGTGTPEDQSDVPLCFFKPRSKGTTGKAALQYFCNTLDRFLRFYGFSRIANKTTYVFSMA